MSRKTTPLPTPTELEILEVLWQDGPVTVREVYEQLQRRRDIGYTTILKLLQIMHQKGLVVRDERARTHVYAAAVKRSETQGRLLADLTARAFGGSASEVVMRALSSKPASDQELQEIRALLDRLEQGQ